MRRWVCRNACNSTAVRLHAALCVAYPSSPSRTKTARLSQVHWVSRASLRAPTGQQNDLGSDPTLSSQTPPRLLRPCFCIQTWVGDTIPCERLPIQHCVGGCTIYMSFLGNTHDKVTSLTLSVVPAASLSAEKPSSCQRQPCLRGKLSVTSLWFFFFSNLKSVFDSRMSLISVIQRSNPQQKNLVRNIDLRTSCRHPKAATVPHFLILVNALASKMIRGPGKRARRLTSTVRQKHLTLLVITKYF